MEKMFDLYNEHNEIYHMNYDIQTSWNEVCLARYDYDLCFYDIHLTNYDMHIAQDEMSITHNEIYLTG